MAEAFINEQLEREPGTLAQRLRDAGYRSDGTPLTDDDVVDLRDRCPECGQVLP
jgi:hypothetical protein